MDEFYRIDQANWKIVLVKKNVTQQAIAEVLNLNKSAFSYRINNEGKFLRDEIKAIADFLNVDPSEFLLDMSRTLTFDEQEQMMKLTKKQTPVSLPGLPNEK